jgi:transcriptional regulator with XRE-family HTH domain
LRLAAACDVTLDALCAIDSPATDLDHIDGAPLPKLAALREWSLRDLARSANVSRSSLARVSEGGGSVETLARIAAALEVSPDALGRAVLRSRRGESPSTPPPSEAPTAPAPEPGSPPLDTLADRPQQPERLGAAALTSLSTLADCAKEHGVTRQRMNQLVKELASEGHLNVTSLANLRLVSPTELRAALEARRQRTSPLAGEGWTTFDALAKEMGVVASRVRQLVSAARRAGALSTIKRGRHVAVPEKAFWDYMAERSAAKKSWRADPSPRQSAALEFDDDDEFNPDHVEAQEAAAEWDENGDPDDDSVIWEGLPRRSIWIANR